MATIDQASRAVKHNRLLLIGLGLVAVVAAVLLVLNLTGPPQMGADERVFSGVDALFTAVTARDEKLLAQCEQRLHALKGAGKLPRDASDYLDGIIQKARAGRWQTAAERLYEFMRAQRRDGRQDHPEKMEKSRANSSRK